MTAPDPADTVIEQAARRLAWAMADADGIHPGDFETDPFDDLTDDAQRDVLAFARALHDAGLLADPADRDERDFADVVNEAIRQKRRANDAITRAERAEAEVAELREKWLAFTSALGFGDNRTEPAAELSEMIDPIEQAFSDTRDHQECAVICELCGDPLAAKTCDECHGSGCLPNSALAYLECSTCAGVGKVHEGCVEKSYAELVAEVAELRAEARRLDESDNLQRAERAEAENTELRAELRLQTTHNQSREDC